MLLWVQDFLAITSDWMSFLLCLASFSLRCIERSRKLVEMFLPFSIPNVMVGSHYLHSVSVLSMSHFLWVHINRMSSTCSKYPAVGTMQCYWCFTFWFMILLFCWYCGAHWLILFHYCLYCNILFHIGFLSLIQYVPLEGSPGKCWFTNRTKVQYSCMSYL
jgi:hypothetical protein